MTIAIEVRMGLRSSEVINVLAYRGLREFPLRWDRTRPPAVSWRRPKTSGSLLVVSWIVVDELLSRWPRTGISGGKG
jgi:hypothetical protein